MLFRVALILVVLEHLRRCGHKLLLLAALSLLVTPAMADFWDEARFDAVGAAQPLDGAPLVEIASWDLGAVDFGTGTVGEVLNEVFAYRRLWFDVFNPSVTPGAGLSVDITADRGPAALGVGYDDDRWLVYLATHLEVGW